MKATFTSCISAPGAPLKHAWEHTVGWFYWSYKIQVTGPELDGWDFGKSVALDYLTTEHLAPTIDRNDPGGGTETGLPRA